MSRTPERSKTSTATIIKMTDWSPDRPNNVATKTDRPATSNHINNLEEARQVIAKLSERNKAQGHLLQAWKHRLKQQNEMLVGLHREREEQMRLLTSQLLLLEANLRAKQGKIDGLLNQRDRIISGQQETIRSLEKELDRCRSCASLEQQPASLMTAIRPQSLQLASNQQLLDKKNTNVVDNKTEESTTSSPDRKTQVRVLGREQGDESLDDSDSAVVIDDDHRHSPTFAQNISQVRVIRSISDVVDSTRMEILVRTEKQGILKSARLVRNHQRRVMFLQPEEPEVEEEDEEEEEGSASSSSDDSPFNKRGHKTFLRGSFERMPVHQDPNRGSSALSSSSLRAATHCSNHRSVTRPRDVKFKKNNKGSMSPWKPTAVDGSSPTSSGNQEFQTSFSSHPV